MPAAGATLTKTASHTRIRHCRRRAAGGVQLTMTLGRLVFAICGVVVCAQGTAEGGDHFLDAHARRIAANQYHGFSIRFKDGRTAFQPREPIEIELVYDRR